MRTLFILALTACDTAERASSLDVAAAVSAVTIDIAAGDVRVETGPVTHVHVERVSRGAVDETAATAQVLGDALRLTDGCARLAPCSVDLVVTVPEGVAVDVRTGAGRVELYDLDADARVQVGDGDVSAHGLAGGLRAQVGWGDVSASFVTTPGEVVVGAAGGDVTVLLPAGRYALDLDGAAGERVTGLEADATGARVSVRAQAGRVYVGRG